MAASDFPIPLISAPPGAITDDTAILFTQTTGPDGKPTISAIKITGLSEPADEPEPATEDIQFNWKCQSCPARSTMWRLQCPSCGNFGFVDVTA
ncbi:hypothetical protein ACQSSU_20600 [Micromonospora echinospora]